MGEHIGCNIKGEKKRGNTYQVPKLGRVLDTEGTSAAKWGSYKASNRSTRRKSMEQRKRNEHKESKSLNCGGRGGK